MLKARVTQPHVFRLISQAQATAAELAIYKWTQGKAESPPPQIAIANFRSAMYNQTSRVREIQAFTCVSTVASIELIDTALLEFKADRIIVPFTVLRGLVERIAHAAALNSNLETLPAQIAAANEKLRPVLERADVISRALYGTQREWQKLTKVDLRTTKPKAVAYEKKEFRADAAARNILNSIDDFEKRVPGTRLAYEILCEFLHPNIGDLWGTTISGKAFSDKHGTRHLTREIGLGKRDFTGFPDQLSVLDKVLDICGDAIAVLPVILAELDSVAEKVADVSNTFAHFIATEYRSAFRKEDPCPCLSGLTLKACARSRRRVESKSTQSRD